MLTLKIDTVSLKKKNSKNNKPSTKKKFKKLRIIMTNK